jgi:hypothetical protein
MLSAKRTLARACAVLALLGSTLWLGAPLARAQSAGALTLLAGQTPKEGLPAHLQGQAWSAYSQAVQRNWKQYHSQIGEPMQAWAGKQIPAFQKTVFYPFSGPDFATVSQMFPQAKRYVMVAMQAAERPIDFAELKPEAARQTLEVLTGAWENYGHDGFFVTEYLDKYLHKNKVRIGASTFLSAFFQLKGLKVNSITPIQVNAAGEVEELPAVFVSNGRASRCWWTTCASTCPTRAWPASHSIFNLCARCRPTRCCSRRPRTCRKTAAFPWWLPA